MDIPFDSREMKAFVFGRAQEEEGNAPLGLTEEELAREAVADDIFLEGRDICRERAFRFLIYLKRKTTSEYAGYLAAGIKAIRFNTERTRLHVFFSKTDLEYAIEAVNALSRFTEFYLETKRVAEIITIKAVGIRLKTNIREKVLSS